MIQSSAPITVGTAAMVQDLAALFQHVGTLAEVKIINSAPNPLQVDIGPDRHWLDSWSADVFCLRGQSRVTLTPVVVQTSGTAASSNVASLLLTVANQVGEIPGTFPVKLFGWTTTLGQPTPQNTTSLPAVGNQATVTLAATPGVRWQAYAISLTLFSGSAGLSPTVALRDGLSGAGAIIWGAVMAISGAGGVDRIAITGLNISGTRGNAMTLEFLTNAANISESCSLGAFQT